MTKLIFGSLVPWADRNVRCAVPSAPKTKGASCVELSTFCRTSYLLRQSERGHLRELHHEADRQEPWLVCSAAGSDTEINETRGARTVAAVGRADCHRRG